MSNSVATALRKCKEMEMKDLTELKKSLGEDAVLPQKFQNCDSVIVLFQLLNDSFDIMNARRPKDGINRDNWPQKKEVYKKTITIVSKSDDYFVVEAKGAG